MSAADTRRNANAGVDNELARVRAHVGVHDTCDGGGGGRGGGGGGGVDRCNRHEIIWGNASVVPTERGKIIGIKLGELDVGVYIFPYFSENFLTGQFCVHARSKTVWKENECTTLHNFF